MELLCEGEVVQVAIIVNLVFLTIVSVLVILMYRNMRQIIKEIKIDKSLHLKIEMEKARYENMKAQNSILMTENTRVMDMNEDLAILLSQKKQ